jgi:hypothetical protein
MVCISTDSTPFAFVQLAQKRKKRETPFCACHVRRNAPSSFLFSSSLFPPFFFPLPFLRFLDKRRVPGTGRAFRRHTSRNANPPLRRRLRSQSVLDPALAAITGGV